MLFANRYRFWITIDLDVICILVRPTSEIIKNLYQNNIFIQVLSEIVVGNKKKKKIFFLENANYMVGNKKNHASKFFFFFGSATYRVGGLVKRKIKKCWPYNETRIYYIIHVWIDVCWRSNLANAVFQLDLDTG